MKVTLKDGSFKEYAQPMAVIDIAKDISEGLARMACVAEIDGEVKDLRTIVDKDCTLNIFTAKDPEGLAALRHTASHVMAQAIKRIWPETKLAIGPSIADGFYYDIDRDEPVTSDDLAKIEAEMKRREEEAKKKAQQAGQGDGGENHRVHCGLDHGDHLGHSGDQAHSLAQDKDHRTDSKNGQAQSDQDMKYFLHRYFLLFVRVPAGSQWQPDSPSPQWVPRTS